MYLVLSYSIVDRLWKGSTLWIQFCNHVSGPSAFPHILLRDHLFFNSDLLVTGRSSVFVDEVQDGRLCFSSRWDLRAFAVPQPAYVLSALPLGRTHSVSPANLWGLWGRWGVCLPNTVTDYMPAMSDLLSCRLPLIQTGSSFWSSHHFAWQVSGHQNCYSGDWTWHQNTGEAHKIRILAAKNKKWKYREDIASITLEWG